MLLITSVSLQELFKENRLLKTIQKRQELALSKYEGTKAELPQLIRSHNEEVRILRAMVKQVSIASEFPPARGYINTHKLHKTCSFFLKSYFHIKCFECCFIKDNIPAACVSGGIKTFMSKFLKGDGI
jgi:hypothetical protein